MKQLLPPYKSICSCFVHAKVMFSQLALHPVLLKSALMFLFSFFFSPPLALSFGTWFGHGLWYAGIQLIGLARWTARQSSHSNACLRSPWLDVDLPCKLGQRSGGTRPGFFCNSVSCQIRAALGAEFDLEQRSLFQVSSQIRPRGVDGSSYWGQIGNMGPPCLKELCALSSLLFSSLLSLTPSPPRSVCVCVGVVVKVKSYNTYSTSSFLFFYARIVGVYPQQADG